MNPRWFSALSCNILFLKEDDVQNDTERDEEEGKTQNLNFSNLTVAFVYCKHFQHTDILQV